MPTFYERYLQGEHGAVWEELSALGEAVRWEDIYPDAEAVARETMRRVRHNIEVLIPRLEECGYQFGYGWMEEWPDSDREWMAGQSARFRPPSENILSTIENFENTVGALLFSLRVFYLEIGEVNLVGTHERWEELFRAYATHGLEPPNFDPLFVWALREEMLAFALSWQEEKEDGEPFLLPIAPDAYFKYYPSGSGSYEIAIPNVSVDALLLNEWHQTTFVEYLRLCFHYGGLPGIQRIAKSIPNELAYLRRDLLPI